jgi:hypothetical protein
MAITTSDTLMTEPESGHQARWRPHAAADGAGAWVSTRAPGRLLDHGEAFSSLVLAELEAHGHAASPHAAQLRARLGLGEVPPCPDPPRDAA